MPEMLALLYTAGSEATNSTGGISDSSMFNGVGTDVFLFVSGTRTDDKPGSLPRLGKGTAVYIIWRRHNRFRNSVCRETSN